MSVTDRPMTDSSPPNTVRHVRADRMSGNSPARHVASAQVSSSVKSRPSMGRTPSMEKNPPVTRMPSRTSGCSRPVIVTWDVDPPYASTSANDETRSFQSR